MIKNKSFLLFYLGSRFVATLLSTTARLIFPDISANKILFTKNLITTFARILRALARRGIAN